MSFFTAVCNVCGNTYTTGMVGTAMVGSGHVCPVKTALVEAEATLKYIQAYVGLLVQYVPDASHRVAAAREQANAALAGPHKLDPGATGDEMASRSPGCPANPSTADTAGRRRSGELAPGLGVPSRETDQPKETT